MKTFIQFGAWNIGQTVIGKHFSKVGCEVIFESVEN